MNKSISTFMILAVTAVIISTLFLGVYKTLHNKNTVYQDNLGSIHQLQ